MNKIKEYILSFNKAERVFIISFIFLIFGGFTIYRTYNPQYAYWWKIEEIKLRKHFGDTIKKQKNVIFVVPNLSLAGAPVMYARLVKLLQQHYNFAVMYITNGVMRTEFENMGVYVMRAPLTPKNHDWYMNFLKKHFNVCITSGEQILYEHSQINKEIPTVFWLQEVDSLLKEFTDIPETGVIPPDSKDDTLDDISWLFDPVRIIQQADVVTVSKYARDSLFGLPAKEVKIIYNSVSEEELADSFKEGNSELYYRLLQQKAGKTMVVYVGRIVEQKGIHVLMQAIASLPSAYQEKSVFYIIGGGEDQYAPALEKQYSSLKNVVWTGVLKRKILQDYYRVADMMIVPSINSDAAPCVVTEAAMYQMPSIITEKVGSDYLIEDKKSGFIISSDDVEKLKQTLMYVIDHPEERKMMGQSAYQKFLQTSTPEVFQKSWMQKLEQKMQEDRNRSK